jgi:hypothetical protein
LCRIYNFFIHSFYNAIGNKKSKKKPFTFIFIVSTRKNLENEDSFSHKIKKIHPRLFPLIFFYCHFIKIVFPAIINGEWIIYLWKFEYWRKGLLIYDFWILNTKWKNVIELALLMVFKIFPQIFNLVQLLKLRHVTEYIRSGQNKRGYARV